MRHAQLVVLLALWGGTARADSDESFLGWSADGTFYATHTDACGISMDTVCANDDRTAATLPDNLGELNPGECQTSQDVDKLAKLGREGIERLVPDHGARPPAGAKIAYKASKTGGVVTITAGKKKHVETIDDVPGTTLASSLWRGDGHEIAVSIIAVRPSTCDNAAPTHAVHLIDVSDLGLSGTGAGHDRKAATTATNKGVAFYKKRQWKPAIDAFKEAIKADDSFVLPHYDLAAVSSLVDDLPTVKQELGWLGRSTDPDAAKRLDKAKSDPDFDFASTDPDVRTLMGADPYPEDARERLLERHAIWTADGVGCDRAAVQLQFTDQTVKDELMALKVTLIDDCKGKRSLARSSEAWNEGPAIVAQKQLKSLLGGDLVPLRWERCAGSTVEGSCFRLKGVASAFHRGTSAN